MHVKLVRIGINTQLGFATLEYIALLMVILGLFYMSNQLARNCIQGYFRKGGEGFSYNRQHDPRRTRDCIWNDQLQTWYSEKCFVWYAINPPPAADSPTNMTCRQDLTRLSCGPVLPENSFRAACHTTCRYADLEMGVCYGPCSYLPPPNPL